MTPKEKADELIDKFLSVKDKHTDSYILFKSESKECALIACDEILYVLSQNSSEYDFWISVIRELNKL